MSVIAKNWLNQGGPRSGPRSRRSFEDDLRSGPCTGVCGPELARVSKYSSLNPV